MYTYERRIIELKAKVVDNELYTAKLMKEREQLQDRVTWLEEQSIKEITCSSKEVQFNYLIPSIGKSIIIAYYCVTDCIQLIDNLKCLSDVQVAEKKLFLIQGDKPQLMNWENYGLRIGVQEDSLLPFDTVEAAVVALVGGQFQFPPNTVLVSAVYAVSLSKPLLKQFKLELQHCIDLTGQSALSHYLKFAIAPVNTPSLPYQFSIVEGGEFSSNGGYGFIKREDFCLVCILGLLIVSMAVGGGGGGGGGGAGGGGRGGGQQQQGTEVVPAQQQQGDALAVLAQQHQQQIQEQQGEQSQDVQQEEGELQEEGGNQQGGEEQGDRQSQKQSELPEQQQQEGGQPKEEGEGNYQEGDKEQEEVNKADSVHVDTATDAVLCTESSSEYANSEYQ